MFNFSNCSECSQVTLGSIFTDWQGRRTHQSVCWDLLCITDLWYKCCLHLLTFSSKAKAWTKPRTGHGRIFWQDLVVASQQVQGSLPEHKPCKQSAVLQKVRLCQCEFGEAPFTPQVSQGLWYCAKGHRVSPPGTCSRSALEHRSAPTWRAAFYFLWFLSLQEKASKKTNVTSYSQSLKAHYNMSGHQNTKGKRPSGTCWEPGKIQINRICFQLLLIKRVIQNWGHLQHTEGEGR